MNLHPKWENRPASLRLALAASCSAERVRRPALSLLDHVQFLPSDLQVEAIAALLVIFASALGVDAHDLVSRAKRQAGDIEAFEHDVLAVADYVKGELR